MNTSPIVRFALASCVAAAGAGMSACDSGPRPPAGVGQDPVAGAYPRITIDGGLARFLVADYPAVVTKPATEDKPLWVQVPVRSQADNEFIIQYNFTWLDAQGVKVGESGWRTENMPSRRQMMLSANAMTKQAVEWRLDVRSAR